MCQVNDGKERVDKPCGIEYISSQTSCMVPVQDHDFEDENVTKHLEKVGVLIWLTKKCYLRSHSSARQNSSGEKIGRK
jgi:hypothetical protein